MHESESEAMRRAPVHSKASYQVRKVVRRWQVMINVGLPLAEEISTGKE